MSDTPKLLTKDELAYIRKHHGISRIEVAKLLGHIEAQDQIIEQLKDEVEQLGYELMEEYNHD